MLKMLHNPLGINRYGDGSLFHSMERFFDSMDSYFKDGSNWTFSSSSASGEEKWIPSVAICASREEAEKLSKDISKSLGVEDAGVVGVNHFTVSYVNKNGQNKAESVHMIDEEEERNKALLQLESDLQKKEMEISSLNDGVKELKNKISKIKNKNS